MKNLQQFCGAAVLTLTLTLSVLGGEIGTPGITAPPPPSSQQSSVTGEIPGPGATAMGDMSTPGVIALDLVTETTLDLLQSVMFFF
jgi:hypothetical protein